MINTMIHMRPLMKRVCFEPWFFTCGLSYKRPHFVEWDSHPLWHPLWFSSQETPQASPVIYL